MKIKSEKSSSTLLIEKTDSCDSGYAGPTIAFDLKLDGEKFSANFFSVWFDVDDVSRFVSDFIDGKYLEGNSIILNGSSEFNLELYQIDSRGHFNMKLIFSDLSLENQLIYNFETITSSIDEFIQYLKELVV